MTAIVLALALSAGSCDPSAGMPCEYEEEGASQLAGTSTQTEWYGGQTLLVDAISGGFFFIPPLAGAVFLFGGPVVHAGHGRPGIALLDLGLRIALPLGALLLSSTRCQSDTGLCGSLMAAGGGAVAASLLDSLLLARAPVSPPLTPSAAPSLGLWKGRDGLEHVALGIAGSS
jgi:hypothetical protein